MAGERDIRAEVLSAESAVLMQNHICRVPQIGCGAPIHSSTPISEFQLVLPIGLLAYHFSKGG